VVVAAAAAKHWETCSGLGTPVIDFVRSERQRRASWDDSGRMEESSSRYVPSGIIWFGDISDQFMKGVDACISRRHGCPHQ
jgi:hypothetical protein